MRTCDINPPEKSERTLEEFLDEINSVAMELPIPSYLVIQHDIVEIWKRYGGEKDDR